MTGGFSLLAASLCVLLPLGFAWAAEPTRPPVRMDTMLDRRACTPEPDGSGTILDADVALGLIAFHSPYLFGGKALRSGLTCGACHGWSGPSGAAVRLTFRKPVPDLHRSAVHGTDIATFAAHAVASEFDGPPVAPRIAQSLAALAKVMSAISSDTRDACRISPPELIDIALQLIIAGIGHANADELDFLVDSSRFALGEMVREESPAELVPAAMIYNTNQTLHDLSLTIDAGEDAVALESARNLSDRWERSLAAWGVHHFVLSRAQGRVDE